MSELEEIGLIEKKRQGQEQGKPDIIYVNKFSEVIEEEERDAPEQALNVEQLYQEVNTVSINNQEVKNLHTK